MKKKSIGLLALAGVLALGLASCGNNGPKHGDVVKVPSSPVVEYTDSQEDKIAYAVADLMKNMMVEDSEKAKPTTEEIEAAKVMIEPVLPFFEEAKITDKKLVTIINTINNKGYKLAMKVTEDANALQFNPEAGQTKFNAEQKAAVAKFVKDANELYDLLIDTVGDDTAGRFVYVLLTQAEDVADVVKMIFGTPAIVPEQAVGYLEYLKENVTIEEFATISKFLVFNLSQIVDTVLTVRNLELAFGMAGSEDDETDPYAYFDYMKSVSSEVAKLADNVVAKAKLSKAQLSYIIDVYEKMTLDYALSLDLAAIKALIPVAGSMNITAEDLETAKKIVKDTYAAEKKFILNVYDPADSIYEELTFTKLISIININIENQKEQEIAYDAYRKKSDAAWDEYADGKTTYEVYIQKSGAAWDEYRALLDAQQDETYELIKIVVKVLDDTKAKQAKSVLAAVDTYINDLDAAYADLLPLIDKYMPTEKALMSDEEVTVVTINDVYNSAMAYVKYMLAHPELVDVDSDELPAECKELKAAVMENAMGYISAKENIMALVQLYMRIA